MEHWATSFASGRSAPYFRKCSKEKKPDWGKQRMLDAKDALDMSRFFARRESPQFAFPAYLAGDALAIAIASAACSKCRFPSVPPPAPLQRFLEARMESAIWKYTRLGQMGMQFVLDSCDCQRAIPGFPMTRQTWRAAFDWMLFTLAALGYEAYGIPPDWMGDRPESDCADALDTSYAEYRTVFVAWKEAENA